MTIKDRKIYILSLGNAVSNLECRCHLLGLEEVSGAVAQVDQRVVREVAAVAMKSTVGEGIGRINGKRTEKDCVTGE